MESLKVSRTFQFSATFEHREMPREVIRQRRENEIRFRRGGMMKKLVILFILSSLPAAATAAITVRVCEADGTTLFDNRDIMVGTKLTIIVHSDDAEPWAGDIAILG